MSQRQVQINAELARCALASDVLAIVRRSVAEFNVVNCGTALSRIARAPDGRRLVAREGGDPDVLSLIATAAGLVRHHARHVESRQLASLLHACGKLGVGKLDAANALVSAVERATEAHASKFNPQELANALWGCAKLGVRVDSALVRLLGDAAAASLKRGGSEKKKAFGACLFGGSSHHSARSVPACVESGGDLGRRESGCLWDPFLDWRTLARREATHS